MMLEISLLPRLNVLFPDPKSLSPNDTLNTPNLALPEPENPLRSGESNPQTTPISNYVISLLSLYGLTESISRFKPPNTQNPKTQVSNPKGSGQVFKK
ncbi:hypothetical protein COLO4_37595 [Corchorus olitorius]|uniref:Uncharacterized protein n=1 Tax=Corchorus olitorius TaxID=93759 RepID=A0A1R3G0M7_9ROSI|nr:hypothetical protein COLO4_37595 [Corchorus olitorius]